MARQLITVTMFSGNCVHRIYLDLNFAWIVKLILFIRLIGPWAEQLFSRFLLPVMLEIFPLLTESRPVCLPWFFIFWLPDSHFSGVTRPGHEADHSPVSSV